MYYDIVNAACLKDYCVFLRFEDGTEGVIDLEHIVGKGEAFSLLADKDYFCRMTLDQKAHTIEWPNGADLNPESLYEALKCASGKPALYRFGA